MANPIARFGADVELQLLPAAVMESVCVFDGVLVEYSLPRESAPALDLFTNLLQPISCVCALRPTSLMISLIDKRVSSYRRLTSECLILPSVTFAHGKSAINSLGTSRSVVSPILSGMLVNPWNSGSIRRNRFPSEHFRSGNREQKANQVGGNKTVVIVLKNVAIVDLVQKSAGFRRSLQDSLLASLRGFSGGGPGPAQGELRN
jgi:hypothetical protein